MSIQNKQNVIFFYLVLTSLPAPTLLARPEWREEPLSSETKKIGFAFTGNFQHYLSPHQETIPESSPLLIGGISALKSYMSIFKKRYGEMRIIINVGDIFQNNADPDIKNQTLEFFDEIGYDAVGLTDQNLIDFLIKTNHYKKKKTPVLASNIINLTTGRPLSKGSIMPYKIVKKDGIKVGILSLTSLRNLSKEEKKKFKGVYFEDSIASFLRTKQIFRKKGVDITLLLARIQGKCSSTFPPKPFRGNKKSWHPIECAQKHSGLPEFVKRLPPHSVDLILSGDDNLAMGYLNKIPIAQLGREGKHLGTIELYYNTKKKSLLTEKTTFYPPVKLCHKFFSSTNHCQTEKIRPSFVKQLISWLLAEKPRTLVPAKFLGHEIIIEKKPGKE